MNDCWEADHDDRVTSAEICNVDFQVVCNVDSGKLATFVEGIQKSEKQHASE
jgi:ABC-type transporter Mla MlaB component